jgi:two pore calcium channel protein 1
MALVVLFFEVLIILVRGTVHMRVTRLVRPVFLVDCYYAHNVRR